MGIKMSNSLKTLVWFRRDFRLIDNAALNAACEVGDELGCFFIDDPLEEGDWPTTGASRWWQFQSLKVLQNNLKKKGIPLIIIKGPTSKALDWVIKASGAHHIFYNKIYEPLRWNQDLAHELRLKNQGVKLQGSKGQLLMEPFGLQNKEKKPFRTFSSFFETIQQRLEITPPVSFPSPLILLPLYWDLSISPDDSLSISFEIGKEELSPFWAKNFSQHWTPGENQALQQLAQFSPVNYGSESDKPALHSTSRLSPFLHHGEITPSQVWQSLSQFKKTTLLESGALAILRQLIWREFSHHLLWYDPQSVEREWKPSWRGFPWDQNASYLKAWQKGQTGYPFIDAAMRELWQTGFIHNRSRMVAASFLCQQLGQDWREGARWFWDTLVDADLAQNTLNWQWVAGCGADSSPYLRIFNPVTQSQTHDKEGEYLRKFIPDLSKIKGKEIHQPWVINPPLSYPVPIIDLSEGRKKALERSSNWRSEHAS